MSAIRHHLAQVFILVYYDQTRCHAMHMHNLPCDMFSTHSNVSFVKDWMDACACGIDYIRIVLLLSLFPHSRSRMYITFHLRILLRVFKTKSCTDIVIIMLSVWYQYFIDIYMYFVNIIPIRIYHLSAF